MATTTQFRFKQFGVSNTATTTSTDMDKESRTMIFESIKVIDPIAPEKLPTKVNRNAMVMMLTIIGKMLPGLLGATHSAGELLDALNQLSIVESPSKTDITTTVRCFITRAVRSPTAFSHRLIAYVFQWVFGQELIDNLHYECSEKIGARKGVIKTKELREMVSEDEFKSWTNVMVLEKKINEIFDNCPSISEPNVEIKVEPKVKCSGTTAEGNSCKRSAISGTQFCKSHC